MNGDDGAPCAAWASLFAPFGDDDEAALAQCYLLARERARRARLAARELAGLVPGEEPPRDECVAPQ